MYFGRYGMSSSTTQDELNAVTVYTGAMGKTGAVSGYHNLGDGHVWRIQYNDSPGTQNSFSFSVSGDPTGTIMVGY